GSDNGPLQRTVEIYSPAYLFKGSRPVITAAPVSLAYGQGFEIETADTADIRRVALIRPGALTHAVDFDQRYVALDFAAGQGALHATAPASPNLAPPGYYMLFVVNRAGVPSVSRFVHLG
ncbi:MAG TPA: galactose oxidase early set domain-containing protein, partial [Actinomycetota bacterium]|nr:galactose oxidase early set domain-containing protein [Actinomycetota bacterium]